MILSVATVVLLAWYSAAGTVMAEPVADATAKAFLAMFALLLVIDIGVRLYGQAGHVSPGKLHEALSL
jgi:DMSO/TMAO reductase YedYZ heme-binding membrane subunit